MTYNEIMFTNVMKCSIYSKTKDKDLDIFKIQVDDIILPWVADGVPKYWWVPMS